MSPLGKNNNENQQQNILYVCPSEKWGSRERQVLHDIQSAREKGWGAYLYCFKGTFLEQKALELGIECFPHRGRVNSRFLKWQKFLNLRQIFASKKIDLVHCYDLHSVWPLSFFLRASSLIPLVVSLNQEVKKSYRQFWYRALVVRADLFMIPAVELEGGVITHLGLPSRKIECLSLGVDVDNIIKNAVLARGKETRILGSYMGPHEKDVDFLLPLLHSVNILNQKAGPDQSCQLILFCENDWRESPFYSELSRMLLDMGLEEKVTFQTIKKGTEPFSQIDLWVGLNQKEFVHDFSLAALAHGLPAVVPRTSFSRELLGVNKMIGESYKLGDARELHEKCERIFSLRQQYQNNLKLVNDTLAESFSLEHYKNQLFSTYQKLLDRRHRLHRKRLLRL